MESPASSVAEISLRNMTVSSLQAASLARLRRRLSEVYRREADRFARTTLRELGDPYRKAIDLFYPEYRKAPWPRTREWTAEGSGQSCSGSGRTGRGRY